MKSFSIIGILLYFTILNISTGYGQKWQQKANYDISVRLDTTTQTIEGNLTLSYHNKSPQGMDSLYFHFWPNAYSSKLSPFGQQMIRTGDLAFRFARPEDLGKMDALKCQQNGKELDILYLDYFKEIGGVKLAETLKPGDSAKIQWHFKVKIPKMFSRMGRDDQHYCLTQWFPKVAKYDEKGWHRMSYLNFGEYFDDFGSYKVAITVPKHFVVAATGNLKTKSEIAWLQQRIKAYKAEPSTSFPRSSDGEKTVVFKEKNIHDFAWFTNPKYRISKSEIPHPSGRGTLESWAFFEADAPRDWKSATSYLESSTLYYSEKVGAYPYQTVKAVAGPLSAGGGMEYPTITVISGDIGDIERVTLHEVGHNWFQGMLGFNERRYPYLDEGINSYYEMRFFLEKYADEDQVSAEDFLMENVLLHMSRRCLDERCSKHSNDFDAINYGVTVYIKTAIHFFFLADYLGQEVFDEAMQAFFQQYQYRHPSPEDIAQFMKKQTDKDLSWFFTGFLDSDLIYDYDFASKEKNENGYLLHIKNKGKINGPVKVSYLLEDEEEWKHTWLEGGESNVSQQVPANAAQVRLNVGLVTLEPGLNKNVKMLKGIKPIGISMLPIHRPETKKISVFPIGGYNTSDGFMLGLAFYNPIIPQPKFEYQLAPMYAFDSKNSTGMGNVQRNWFWKTDAFSHHFSLGISGRSFGKNEYSGGINPQLHLNQYWKWQPKASYAIQSRKNYLQRHQWEFRQANRNVFEFGIGELKERNISISEASYTFSTKKATMPYSLQVSTRFGDQMSQLRMEWKANLYYKEGKDIRFRAFAGTFIKKPSTEKPSRGTYAFTLNNMYARYDYMMDGLYFDRSIESKNGYRQLIPSDGGFATPTSSFRTFNHLIAFSMSARLPISPLRIMVNTAYIPNEDNFHSEDALLTYEVGFQIGIYKDIITVNMPFIYSKDFEEFIEINDYQFKERISINLDLTRLNPFTILKNATDLLF